MKIKATLKTIAWTLLTVCVLLLAFVIYCNLSISRYAESKVYDSVSELPHYHTALVLGTSPESRFGGPNPFFVSRIEAAEKLFKEGKVDKIIVSGDNRYKYYNEPKAMQQALIKKGIPENVIHLDYAGFRTLDSIVRAKEVFGQSSFIIVSQKFHNERAVFIAGKKGIDAIAFNARSIRFKRGFLTYLRELGARCVVYLDLLIGREPHFLGDPIDV